jgi:hypothetical protein
MLLPIHPSFTERPAIVFLEIFSDVESLGDFFRLELWQIPMALGAILTQRKARGISWFYLV